MEVIIGIAGLALTILMYFIGRKEGAKEKHHDYILRQYDRIIDQYTKWFYGMYDSGIHALSKVGLGILENDKNVRDVINRILLMTGESALRDFLIETKEIDLYKFFMFISENNVDTFKNSVSEIVTIMGNNQLDKIRR